MAEFDMRAPQRSRSAGTSFAVYTLLAFAITWTVWVPRAVASRGEAEGEFFLALGSVWSYGPAAAAILAAAWTGGRGAVREVGSRLARWRVGWRWYVAVVGIPVLWIAATLGVARLVGTDVAVNLPEGGVVGLVVAFVALSATDGLGEEVGWRGWALPQLLVRLRALEASLLLGVVWAAWHLPLHFTEGSYLAETPIWVLFARLPATAIVFTWVFRRTHESAFVAVLLHGAMNAAAGLLTSNGAADVAGIAAHWLVALVVLVMAGRDLDRPSNGSGAVRDWRRRPT